MKRPFRKAILNLLRQLTAVDVNEQLFLEIEYLRAENQVLKAQLAIGKKRLRFTDEQRRLLAGTGKILRKRLHDLASIVSPATILRWHRELIARKFDSSMSPGRKTGRPETPEDTERLILQMAHDNPSWGYLRIAGAIQNLGLKVAAATIATILRRNGVNPSGDRQHGGMSWADFISVHKDVLWATDFFTAEVWTNFGLITYYVLFFIHIGSRKVVIGGITAHPDGEWMAQAARNLSGMDGALERARYLIHDRDAKYTAQFDAIMKSTGIKPIRLPPFSPNLNAYAENFVGKIKAECLNQMIFTGEKSLRHVVAEYVAYYQTQRNHQGMDNQIPFPEAKNGGSNGKIKRKERLGGLLKYYYRDAA